MKKILFLILLFPFITSAMACGDPSPARLLFAAIFGWIAYILFVAAFFIFIYISTLVFRKLHKQQNKKFKTLSILAISFSIVAFILIFSKINFECPPINF